MRRAYLPIAALGVAELVGAAPGCGDTDERPATWSYISATIIQPNCGTARCHAVGAQAGFDDSQGFRLDTREAAYESLTQQLPVIDTEDPVHCELISRLRGYRIKGDGSHEKIQTMPPDEPLPQADIDLIQKWIAAGAKND